MYYGQPAQRTYWCGCSQGGREGLIALQTLPAEYDGILAGGSAVYWMRFQMAQAWSGLVIKDMLRSKGKDLTPAQINQTVRSPDPGEIKLSRV
jgi:feruloyl esterase